MPAHHRCCTIVTAIVFAATMLVLGLLNPNAAPGRAGCGLTCEAPTAPSIAPFTPR